MLILFYIKYINKYYMSKIFALSFSNLTINIYILNKNNDLASQKIFWNNLFENNHYCNLETF